MDHNRDAETEEERVEWALSPLSAIGWDEADGAILCLEFKDVAGRSYAVPLRDLVRELDSLEEAQRVFDRSLPAEQMSYITIDAPNEAREWLKEHDVSTYIEER